MTTKLRQKVSIPAGTLRDHPGGVRVLLQTIDLAMILSCFVVTAGLLLDRWDFVGLVRGNLLMLAVTGFSFLFAGDLLKLYRSWRAETRSAEIICVLQTWVVVVILLLIMAFVKQTDAIATQRYIQVWLVATPLALGLWRFALRFLVQVLRGIGFNRRRAIVVGTNPSALDLAQQIASREGEIGIHVLGMVDREPPPRDGQQGVAEFSYLGDLSRAVEMARARTVDVIYIALPLDREPEIRELVNDLADATVSVRILVPELFEPVLYNQTTRLGHLRTVSIYSTPFEDRLNERVKRIEDVVLSVVFLAISAVPMLVIAGVIWVTSGSPILFKQRRYGLGGKPVEVWKFRTMTVCEDGAQFVQATKNDPRVTPFGAFLRKTSLDELPQLINVLTGSMSIVGPRPHAVSMNEEYRKSIKFYMLRHAVKPGITGWAQVNGWRGETDTPYKMEKRVEYDLFYIKNWSLALDLRIILMTFARGFIGKNAY